MNPRFPPIESEGTMNAQEENIMGEGEDFEDIQEELELLDATEIGDEAEKEAKRDALGTQDPLAILYKHHPEAILDYTETVVQRLPLTSAPAGTGGETPDPNHKSMPFLTQYERTSILGFRANQLAQGARPYIVVPPHVTATLEIARMELEQRRLPLIMKRPMPDGTFEYWRLSDLMVL
jgi:DNA-directed RNA polymerase subunit K/omega